MWSRASYFSVLPTNIFFIEGRFIEAAKALDAASRTFSQLGFGTEGLDIVKMAIEGAGPTFPDQ
jgi:hypothetical protein